MTGKYQAYPEYKESRVEWLGDVPSSWCVSRLAYIFTKANAGEVIDKTYWGGGGEVLYTCNRTPLQSDYLEFPEEKRTEQNDLLLTRNGTPYVHKPKLGSIYSNVVQRITVENDFDRDYLMHCLGNSARNLKGYGVSIESLNFDNWKSLSFAYPAKSEQIRVVKFLDHETAKIDTLIEKQQQLIKLLKEKRQAVISHAVTKGLNPNAPMRDSGIEWLGEVPEGWEVFSSKHLFPESNKKAALGDQQLSATQDYGVISQMKFMQLAGRRVVQLNRNQELRKRVDIDDFIISMRSFQGGLERAWDEGGIRSSYVVLKPSNNAEISFYQYLFKSVRYIQALQSTTNFIRDGQDMSYQNFVLIDLPLPPLEEQQNIASFLRREIILIDQLVDKATQLTLLMQERRTALISAAVTGKIDVRNWQAPQPSNTSNNNYKEVAP